MKLITRDTDYAIRALLYMAKKKERVSAAELVDRHKIPRPFLRKILQLLNKRGVLCSCRGYKGGFILTTSPDKISVLDIIEIFQGRPALNKCMFKKQICPNIKKCKLKKKLDKLQSYVARDLKGITLRSLLC